MMNAKSRATTYPAECHHPEKKVFERDVSTGYGDSLSPLTFTERLLRAKYGNAGFNESTHTAESLTKKTLRYVLNTYFDRIIENITTAEIPCGENTEYALQGSHESNEYKALIEQDLDEVQQDFNQALLQLANKLETVLLDKTYKALKEEEAVIRKRESTFKLQPVRIVQDGIRENTVAISTSTHKQYELLEKTSELTTASDELTGETDLVVTDSGTLNRFKREIRNSDELQEIKVEEYTELLELYTDDPVKTIGESMLTGVNLTDIGFTVPMEVIICVEETENTTGQNVYPLVPWYGTVSCTCELHQEKDTARQLCRHELYALSQQRDDAFIVDQHNVIDQRCKRLINPYENKVFRNDVMGTPQTLMESLPS